MLKLEKTKVLIFGATGYLGRRVVQTLIGAGCTVAALAREPQSNAEIEQMGAQPVPGSLADLPSIADELTSADVIVVAGRMPYETEEPLVEMLGRILDDGGGQTLVFTSGTGVLGVPSRDGTWDQRSFSEVDPFTPPPWLALRVRTENRVRRLAEPGVRSMIIRPPLIWGHGGSFQIPAVFRSVHLTGQACYVGKGLNVYSNVHVDDLAFLYLLAIERGKPGSVYHAVGGEVNFRSIAECVASVAGTTTRSLSAMEAEQIWGPVLARTGFSTNSRSVALVSRAELGWVPQHVDVCDDILHGSYREAFESGRFES